MTDIYKWQELIKKEIPPSGTQLNPDGDQEAEYYMVPFSPYHLGSLLGLLRRSIDKDTGDWFEELIHRCEGVVNNTDMTYQDLEDWSNFRDNITEYDSLESYVYDPMEDNNG